MPKQIQPLSDIQVKTTKPNPKEVKLFDGGLPEPTVISDFANKEKPIQWAEKSCGAFSFASILR